MTKADKQNKGPSTAELERLIREKTRVEFLLANGERLVGTIRWFDEQAFSVVAEGQQPITILRPAVIAYRVYG